MSIFESIKNAIFGHAAAAPPGAAAPAAPGTPAAPAPGPQGAATAAGSAAVGATATPALTAAGLETLLTQLSAKNPQKLNWQTSIVDLLKLVGLDPSFANRKQLAQELGYTGDTADSATMNIWLHKAVMDKLAQSGGTVPPSLKT